MLRKKLACLFLALTTLLQPFAAQAVDLGSAFTNLVGPDAAYSMQKPGRFQSAARGGFSGGAFEMKVPRGSNVPQLFSVTPPNISVGCNGISAHFGGFSFISGKEFEALLKRIASGAALGFVTSLVMKTLCPPCEAVVQELKTAAQTAARLARDSCQWGREMGEKFLAGTGVSGGQSEMCSSTAASNNSDGDSLSAFSGLCSSLSSAAKALHEFNESAGDTEEQKAAKRTQADCTATSGNQTWRKLAAFDGSGTFESGSDENYRRKLLLLNIMGAELQISGDDDPVSCETGNGEKWTATNNEPHKYCPPPMDNAKLVGHFMCGSPAVVQQAVADGKISGTVQKYCADYIGTSEAASGKVWRCGTGAGGVLSQAEKSSCNVLTLTTSDTLFTGEGFLISVSSLLREAVERVRTGNPNAFTDETGRKIVRLVQVAPYPLYQAINAAAVYPSAASDLIDSISVLVAEQFAYAMFDELLRLDGRSSSSICLSRPQATELLKFLESFRASNYARKTQMSQNMAMQQALTEQIRQINVAIQRQVMSDDMLSNGRMGNALNNAVSGVVSKPGAAPATP